MLFVRLSHRGGDTSCTKCCLVVYARVHYWRLLLRILSMLSDRYFGRAVCHMGHAYSTTDRITDVYILSRSFVQTPDLLIWYIIYTRLGAFFTIMSKCALQLRSPQTITANAIACGTRSISVLSIVILGHNS